MASYIVLMGVQGAGKGTQAEILEHKLALPHITTGGMFRARAAQGDEFGQGLKATMDRGELIDDVTTVRVVRERLKAPDATNGVIFDGFPRTLPQAQALDSLLAEESQRVTLVPFFDLEKSVAIRRLTSRWQCRNDDQHIYNMLDNPPKVPGICDICGGALFQRADDTPEAVAKRIETFYEKTAPLLDYYRDRGLLHTIDGDQPIDSVTIDVLAALVKTLVR